MSQYVASLIIEDKDAAHTIAAALQDLIDPVPDALTLFEHGATGIPDPAAPATPPGAADFKAEMRWKIDAYYDFAPDAVALAAELAAVTGLPVPEMTVGLVPDTNWVAMSQACPPPRQLWSLRHPRQPR